MSKRGRSWGWVSLVACAVAAMGCSGSTTTSSSSGGTSGGGTSGGGGGTNGSQSTALVGTWDVTTSFNSTDSAGTLTITQTSLAMSWTHFTLNADLSGSAPVVSGMDGNSGGDITATRSAEPLDLGIVPYGLGGTWVFQGQKADRCNVTARAELVSADCSNLGTPPAKHPERLRLRGGQAARHRAHERAARVEARIAVR